jgi:hypothetical protein
MKTTRRNFLISASLTAAAGMLPRRLFSAESARSLPIRQITRGPKFHWFGYYDKLQFDPSGRYVLCMEADFEHRSPRPDDGIKVGMVDLEDNDRWIELGESRAWCWQQGCMLQWLPGSASEILWNDRQSDRYVCHILDVKTRESRTLPHPVYAVSPNGAWAVATSFSRLADLRPGYGYAGVPDPYREQCAPDDTGIFHVDLRTGEQKLLFSLAEAARIPYEGEDLSQTHNWFNHLLVNPDGSRFVFLHRWKAGNGRRSRMISMRPDGTDLRMLIGTGWVSHFIWRDPSHVLAYSKTTAEGTPWGFFLWEDRPGGAVEPIGNEVMTGDGHCTYLPQRHWIVNDTYPDRQNRQHLYLFDTEQKQRIDLGAFAQPPEYFAMPQREGRVDLHPRCSRDGRLLTVDSPHTGEGRQLHLIDISRIVAAKDGGSR